MTKCPHCGEEYGTGAFGLPPYQIKKIFENTVGPKGKTERKRTGLTGYLLFAKHLEQASNKLKESCTTTK